MSNSNDFKSNTKVSNDAEYRGYQPKPDGTFGYQPVNKSEILPKPPTSGSNAESPNNK